jgi:hypothetical protein
MRWFLLNNSHRMTQPTAPRDSVNLPLDAVGEAPIEGASPTANRDRIFESAVT